MEFCTAINCMDGQVQLPVIQFLQDRFKAECVDCITEPAPVQIFDKVTDLMLLNSIYSRINISVQQHHSKGIAVCAHADCSINQADEETQMQQLRRAVIFLKESYYDLDVIGLWIDEDGKIHEAA